MHVSDERLLRLRALTVQVYPWAMTKLRRGRYRFLSEDELRARRRSDTVFVFGSGASLNDVTAETWEEIAAHDTLGFNWFVHQRFVRCDFQLIRGIPDTDFVRSTWKRQLDEYFSLLRESPLFAETVFCVQMGLRATNGNRALGFRYLPAGAEVFQWRTNTRRREPAERFEDGLTHAHSVLSEAVNLAYLTGWKRIVLAGVDLYDRRYFWLPPEEARTVDSRRGATAADAHTQSSTGLIELLGDWRRRFSETGVSLEVLNPRSLLTATLPLYRAGTPAR
jgi:hypothetical protein